MLTGALAQGQIAGLKPVAGAMAEGKIAVPAGSDAATEIPVTVVRGAKPGPTLAVIAGMSGTEYGPIAATQQIAATLKLAELSGTLILVHIANLPAFIQRDVYLNPVDHKDLNRVFPGKADGTSSERIAYAITTQVIDKADAVLILEAGGANTALAPHVYQAVSGDATMDAKMAAMAMTFGISYIVVERTAKTSKVSPESAAVARSKPVLKVMCGSFGVVDSRTLDILIRGMASVMTQLEMIPGTPAKTRLPVFFDQTVSIESPQTGIVLAYAARGQNVRKGESIFGVAGYQAKNPQIVKTPIDGIVISMLSTPPVNKGETVVLIGTPREQ